MAESEHDDTAQDTRAVVKKLEAVSWGLFFIWMGVAFLAGVGWGVGLLGVGVIALAAQVTRRYLGLPVERFWLVIGIIFVVCGVWQLLSIQLGAASGNLLPILWIVVGIVIVVFAFMRKPLH